MIKHDQVNEIKGKSEEKEERKGEKGNQNKPKGSHKVR